MPGVEPARPVICAVVLDVDGTVLRSDHSVSPATSRAIARVIAVGVPVILASSRSPRGLQPVQGALGLVGHHLVAYQGALTGRLTGTGSAEFEVLHELPMDLIHARVIAAMAADQGYSVSWYAGLTWYVDQIDFRIRREAAVTGETPTVVDLFSLTAPAHKILCIGPVGTSPDRLYELAERMPEGTVGRRSHSTYLEVTVSGADKPVGVEALASHLGFCADQVAAFGDGDNDLGMFAYAGTAVAMGNATAAIAAAATMTTATQDRDGVAQALTRLLVQGSIRPAGANT